MDVFKMKPAILGGTFDPLHDGHKALFSKAFELSEYLLIGLTSDEMAGMYRQRTVTDFTKRKRKLAQYLKSTYPKIRFEIKKMDEVFNIPIIKNISDGFLIVSEGKLKIAENINKIRKQEGIRQFKIVTVPYVLAVDGLPIKATRIHEGAIDIHGKLLKPPVVAVGSSNKIKLKAVSFAFEQVFGKSKIKGFEVDSGVHPQPKGKETVLGARNRARDALEQCPDRFDAKFGVGLEAGLFWIPSIKNYIDVQYCVVVDKGGHFTYGHSPGFTYPPSFQDKIKKGDEVETIVADLYNIKDIGEKQGAIGYLTDNRVTRKDLLVSAVQMALVPRLKRELYRD
jgi:inosine/xanthosine triphosphatase